MTWHGGRRYLAAQARIVAMDPIESQSPPGGLVADAHATDICVRFGLTVGKRNARRAVERALIKRVLRESARHAAPALDRAACRRRVDLVLRLKAPCPVVGELTRPQFKRALRAEADSLLAQLAAFLQRDALTAPASRPGGAP
ncbi:MAG: ribonuclease P protein component [Burkholderiaceae bacterium]|nr:ribonuclease P protein component [Burkholderiaceae bacterium]